MANIETLPAPLPLMILKQLDDLKSLDALRRASPCFSAAFLLSTVEVLEPLLQKTLLADVVVEFRVYTLILLRKGRRLQTEEDFDRIYSQAQQPLSRETPPTPVSFALRVFSFYASLCSTILCEKLQRLEALPHECPPVSSEPFFLDRVREWLRSPSTLYFISHTWPPSWPEEQRALRAALRMLILKVNERRPSFVPAWGSSDGEEMWQADEIEEIASSFQELQRNGVLPERLQDTEPLSWNAMALPICKAKASEEQLLWLDYEEKDRSSANTLSKGYIFFHLKCEPKHYTDNPLGLVDWTVFRSLGLGFWSRRRLAVSLKLGSSSHIWDADKVLGPPKEDCDHLGKKYLIFKWWRLYHAEQARRASANREEEDERKNNGPETQI